MNWEKVADELEEQSVQAVKAAEGATSSKNRLALLLVGRLFIGLAEAIGKGIEHD